MAGEVRIQTFVQLINIGRYRQFSFPKPPLLLAAKRCASIEKTKRPTINEQKINNKIPALQ